MATVYHTPPPTGPARPPGPLKLAWQFTMGILFLLAVLLLGGTVFGYLTAHFESADGKRVEERKKILADRQAEDEKYLHDKASWFKKDQGLVRVPIDEAMRMTLTALQAVRPHAAYPVAGTIMDNGAPTSPDKGAGSVPGVTTNPAASNPTVGHPAPTPAPSPSPSLFPAASPAPTAAALPATPAPQATATPTGAMTPSPAGNNANNPGSAPIPGTQAQPAPGTAPAATPATGAGPAPLATPPAQPTPTGTASPAAGSATTPTPSPQAPGANPAGTP